MAVASPPVVAPPRPPARTAPARPRTPAEGNGKLPPSGPAGPDGGRPREGGPLPPARTPAAWSVGAALAIAAVGMMFVGFTSAYLVRRQAPDWAPAASVPPLLWWNTAVLVASSLWLEGWRRWRRQEAVGLAGAASLGLLFVAGQLAVWRQLVRAGVYLASNPHSSFFYVLTGAHGLHVLVAMVWLGYTAVRVARWRPQAASLDGTGVATWRADLQGMVSACAAFWHFMAGLWIFLFALLFAA